MWKGFMEAALPRLNAPAIPNGPAMPEGWQPPSPVGQLLGQIGDVFGDNPPPEDMVDPTLEPVPTRPAPPVQTPPTGPVVRPTAPQPGQPEPQAKPTPPPERKADPLFF
jgi:penicillin-binding protein 1A